MNSISRVRDCDSIFQCPWLYYSGCGYSTATLLHEKVETVSVEVGFDPGGNTEVRTELPLVIPSTSTNRCSIEKLDAVEESIPSRSNTIFKSNSSDSMNWDIPYLAEEFPNQSNYFLSQKNDWNSQLIRDDPYLFSASDIGDTELKSINSLSAQEPNVDPYEVDQDKASKSFCTNKDSSENEVPLQINSVINLKSVNCWLPGMIAKDTSINEAWKNDYSQSKFMLYEFLEIEELNNSAHCEDSYVLNGSQDDTTNNKIEELPSVKENINEYLNELCADNDAEKMINFTKYQEYKRKYKILSRNENTRILLRSHKQNNFCNTKRRNNKTDVKTAYPKCKIRREEEVRKENHSDKIDQKQHSKHHYNTRKSEKDTNFSLVLKSARGKRRDKENFINHSQKYLEDKSFINQKMHECSFCGKVYSSASWFKKHKISHLCQVNNEHHNLNLERNEFPSAKKVSSKTKDHSILLAPLKKNNEKDNLNMEVRHSSADSWLNESMHSSVKNQNILKNSHIETKTLSEIQSLSLLKVTPKNSKNVKNDKINDDALNNLKAICSYNDGKLNSGIKKSSTSVFFHDNITDNKLNPKCTSQNIKHYNTRSYSKGTVSSLTNQIIKKKNPKKSKYEITTVQNSCVMRSLPISNFTCLPENGFDQSENCSVAEKIEHCKKHEGKQHDRCNSPLNSVSIERQVSAEKDVFMQPVVKLRRLDPDFLKSVLPCFYLSENKKNGSNSVSQNSCNAPKADYRKNNSFPYLRLSSYSCHKNFLKQSSHSGNYRNILDLNIVHSDEKGASELRTVDVADSFNENLKGLQLKERVKELQKTKENAVNSEYYKEVSGVGNKTIVTRSKSKKIKLQGNNSEYSENSADCVVDDRGEIPFSQITVKTRVQSAEATYLQKSPVRSLSSDASRSISTDISHTCTRKTRLQIKTHKMTSQDHKASLLNISSTSSNITNGCICDNSQLKPVLPLYEQVANLNPHETLNEKMGKSVCKGLRRPSTRKCNRIKEHTSNEVGHTKSGTFISSAENSVGKTEMNLDFSFVTSAETVIMKGKNRIEAENVLYASEKENKINSSVIETLTTKKQSNNFQGGGNFCNKDRNWRENNTLIKTFKIDRKKSLFYTDKISAMQNHTSNNDAVNGNSLKNSPVINDSKVINSFKSKNLLETTSETLKTNYEGQNEKSYFLRFKKKNLANQSNCLKTKNFACSKCTENSLRSKVSIPNETSTLALEYPVELPHDSNISCSANNEKSIFEKKPNIKQGLMDTANACYSSALKSEHTRRFMLQQKSSFSVKKLIRKFKNCDHLKIVNGLVIFDKTPVVKIERLNL